MADYIAVSNTGKTITVTFSEEFFDRWSTLVPLDEHGRAHVDVEYRQGQILITPSTNGRRVGKHSNGNGGLYVGIASRQMPDWPEHGKITYPWNTVSITPDGIIALEVPVKALPPAKLRNTLAMQKGNAHDTRTDYNRDMRWAYSGRMNDMLAQCQHAAQHPLGFRTASELAGLEELAEAVTGPAPVAFAGANVLVDVEGTSMSFSAPLKLRLKIIAMLQADPQVSGDV